ncbi:MAG: hypothetical protein ACI9T7_003182, partial [Oleiphilaceae bacterium]
LISCVDNIKTAQKLKKSVFLSFDEPSMLFRLIDI